jgi:hypothetical protein
MAPLHPLPEGSAALERILLRQLFGRIGGPDFHWFHRDPRVEMHLAVELGIPENKPWTVQELLSTHTPQNERLQRGCGNAQRVGDGVLDAQQKKVLKRSTKAQLQKTIHCQKKVFKLPARPMLSEKQPTWRHGQSTLKIMVKSKAQSFWLTVLLFIAMEQRTSL